jgi:hypothetical protein
MGRRSMNVDVYIRSSYVSVQAIPKVFKVQPVAIPLKFTFTVSMLL